MIFTEEKLFLAFLINRCTKGAVRAVFDRLEKRMGTYEFTSVFENVVLPPPLSVAMNRYGTYCIRIRTSGKYRPALCQSLRFADISVSGITVYLLLA